MCLDTCVLIIDTCPDSKIKPMKLSITTFLLFLFVFCSAQQKNESFIFPYQQLHVHGPTVVELPDGDLLSAWFEGSGERWADDVAIMGARLKKGKWDV